MQACVGIGPKHGTDCLASSAQNKEGRGIQQFTVLMLDGQSE